MVCCTKNPGEKMTRKTNKVLQAEVNTLLSFSNKLCHENDKLVTELEESQELTKERDLKLQTACREKLKLEGKLEGLELGFEKLAEVAVENC